MNAREAYVALLAGKRVRRSPDAELFYRMDEHGCIWGGWGDNRDYILKVALEGSFELYEKPLTDEQLIAEWELMAQHHVPCATDHAVRIRRDIYLQCARQLRERKL